MHNTRQDISPQRILIIRLSSIGDVVRTLPALSSLRREFPHAHIAWVAEDKSIGILEGHPHLDEIICFERKTIARSLKNPLHVHEGLSRLARFLAGIRRGRFDLVFDFHGILKSGLVALWSGAPTRVGFGRGFVKESSHIFANRKVRPSDAALPRVERNLELIRPFVSPENLTDKAVLGLSGKHRETAAAFVKQRFGASHPLIGIHPGTSRTIKKWPTRSFAALCDMLADSLSAKLLLTWGPGEHDKVMQIHSLSKALPEIGPQTQSLLELAALLEQCDLVVTVDSGPMHIASAIGTPVVAIFGPTDIRVNAPYWQPYKVVSSSMDCSPCDENCDHTQCMEAVTPERVFEAVQELVTDARNRFRAHITKGISGGGVRS